MNPYAASQADLYETPSSDHYQPRLLSWNGRIGRLRYMAYGVALGLCFWLACALLLAVTTVLSPKSYVLLALLGLPCVLAFLVLMFGLGRRRLHDMGHSQWWALLGFVPYVGALFGLWMIFGRGDEGSNEYGPPPNANTKGVVAAACTIPLIFVIGIVAAIAIPAYQGYVTKAKASAAQPRF